MSLLMASFFLTSREIGANAFIPKVFKNFSEATSTYGVTILLFSRIPAYQRKPE